MTPEQAKAIVPKLEAVQGGAASSAEHSDLANAERFAREHRNELRFVAQRSRWLTWGGHAWEPDTTGAAQRAAKATARAMFGGAAAIDDDKRRRAALRWALVTQGEPRLRAMLTVASTEPQVVVSAGDLDRDLMMLACPNGTIDLRTGKLRRADASDLITRSTAIAYDPAAECPCWERMLADVFAEDTDLIAFFRRWVGYCLTGETREHVLAVLHGAGCNGKSTIVEVIKQLGGDLAVTAAFDTFSRTKGGGPRNDLARLAGARIVIASESGEGKRLDEATVKEITGGDTIAARFLYGEHFEFRPAFKLWLVTNHRPRVDGGDDAIWRRLRLIPFNVSFEGREDRTLSARLQRELPGILAWAVRGCLEWQQHGLGSAGAVEAATRLYRQDEDVLGTFLGERCAPNGEIVAADLRAAYEAFCAETGERPVSSSILGRRLTKHGITQRRTKSTRFYVGIQLATTEPSPRNANESGASLPPGDSDDGSFNNSPYARACEDFTDLPSSSVTRHPNNEPTDLELHGSQT